VLVFCELGDLPHYASGIPDYHASEFAVERLRFIEGEVVSGGDCHRVRLAE
jgi:hypothetical protein